MSESAKVTKKQIRIDVELDEKNMPERISWDADDAGMIEPRQAKSLMLSLWDREDQTTMRFDLYTKDLYVDEMKDHFMQSLITMAETYSRATGHQFVMNEMKLFCDRVSQQIEKAEKTKDN